MLASSAAFSKTFGVIANVIIVYIAVQIRGERRQNQEYIASRRPPGA